MKRLTIFLLLLSVSVSAQIIPSTSVIVQDEGATQGQVRTLNCTGAGITCTVSGSTGTLNAAGGSGSSNALDVTIDFNSGDAASLFSTWVTQSLSSCGCVVVAWSPTLSMFVGLGDTSDSQERTISREGYVWSGDDFSGQPTASDWIGLVWAPALGLFQAVGNTGSPYSQSSNGFTWDSSAAGTFPSGGSPRDLIWSVDLGLFIVAYQASGLPATDMIATSANGLTWSLATTPSTSQGWWGVAWSDSLNIAVAVGMDNPGPNAGTAISSTNGTSWTARTPAGTNRWFDVEWCESCGFFAAISQLTSAGGNCATNCMMTSTNGTTWSSSTAIDPGPWTTIKYFAEIQTLVVMNAGGTQMRYSHDGVTWSPTVTLPAFAGGFSWFDFTYSPTLNAIALAGRDGAVIGQMGRSSTPLASGLVYTATVTGQSWVAADSRIVCSPFGSTTDGLTPETVFASGVQAIASNRVVGTGFDLSVYTPHGASGTYRFHCLGS